MSAHPQRTFCSTPLPIERKHSSWTEGDKTTHASHFCTNQVIFIQSRHTQTWSDHAIWVPVYDVHTKAACARMSVCFSGVSDICAAVSTPIDQIILMHKVKWCLTLKTIDILCEYLLCVSTDSIDVFSQERGVWI